MLHQFLRDSFVGRLIYHLSSHKYFNHKEERPDYVIPEKYLIGYNPTKEVVCSESIASDSSDSTIVTQAPIKGEAGEIEDSVFDFDSDLIIVDWDGPDDPENPYNWPLYQKIFFVLQIAFLTTSVYMGSAIFTPGIPDIEEQFGVGRIRATLPLSLFVIGYGVGPMILSPMSENVIFGRTSIYIVTLFIFVILQIPTALATDIASLCVLRFLAGIFASPALATGGASVGDVVTLPYIPVGIASWSLGAVCGPTLGPFIGSILVQLVDWRWTFWFMLIISATSLLILSSMLPETHQQTLLHRKALRLRKITGNDKITSEGEVANKKLTTSELAIDILWRPFEITLFEPVVLLINIYIALVYSIMYLWFEAFPIVFMEMYHFNTIEMGVSYIGLIIGFWIGAAIYIFIINKQFTRKMLAGEDVPPEVFLPLAIYGGVAMPIGIFIFGWAATPSSHWIGPLIGAAIFALGAFTAFQTLFNYLSMSFWRYLASVFASNDLFRSVIAGALPLVGVPLFNNLGSEKFPVGWGSSILGFLSVGMIAIPVAFYIYGPKLRARSKYSGIGN